VRAVRASTGPAQDRKEGKKKTVETRYGGGGKRSPAHIPQKKKRGAIRDRSRCDSSATSRKRAHHAFTITPRGGKGEGKKRTDDRLERIENEHERRKGPATSTTMAKLRMERKREKESIYISLSEANQNTSNGGGMWTVTAPCRTGKREKRNAASRHFFCASCSEREKKNPG